MIDSPPNRIVYCYGEYQQSFRKYSNVEFRQGLSDASDFDGSEPILLVIDDLMQETDENVTNLFTKGSHHRNVIVVFLAQNMFLKNKFARTMSLNAHYMVLLKNSRDASHFANLARQSNGSSPWKHIRTRRENRTVTFSSISDLNRMKT